VRLCREKSSAVTEQVEADVEEERFLVGLRLKNGVILSEAEWTKREPQLHRFLNDGLLERTDGRLRFTDQGFLYSNEVLQEFI
jgi:coproporphyrinogen III oxidase-like Fe-S oxidoreductase